MDMSATTAVISVLGACLAGLLGYYLQGLRADIRRIDRRLDRYEVAHAQAMERIDAAHRQEMERLDTIHRQDAERFDTAHRQDMAALRQTMERIDTAHRQTMERLSEAQGDMMATLASQTATLAAQYQQMERMMGYGERISTLEGALSAASGETPATPPRLV